MKKLVNKFEYKRNILIINSLLIAIFISSNIAINSLILSYENILIVLLLLNLYFIFRVTIEWFLAKVSPIHLLILFLIWLVSSGYIVYELSHISIILNSTTITFISILFIGMLTTSVLSINMQYLVFIRSNTESSQSYLPMVPYKIRPMIIQIPISFALLLITALGIHFVLANYSWFIVLFLPLMMHTLALLVYFLFLDKEHIESRLKELDKQDRGHILTKIGMRLANKDSKSCRKTSIMQYETVMHFLNTGLDPNEVFENRYTLLLPSTCCGDNKLVELLIEKGADVNFKSSLGTTALHLASQHGSYHLAQILVENGAKLDIKDAKNKTALDYANEDPNKDLAKMLVEEKHSYDKK